MTVVQQPRRGCSPQEYEAANFRSVHRLSYQERLDAKTGRHDGIPVHYNGGVYASQSVQPAQIRELLWQACQLFQHMSFQ